MNRSALFFTLFLIVFFQAVVFSQPAYPSTINIAGKTSTADIYSFEWSVGESAAITTMGNSNLLVTNGLLQYNVENQTKANTLTAFLPDEVRAF